MDVDVGSGAVVVLVDVEFATQDVPRGADAEIYEHDSDADFEEWSNGFVAFEGEVFSDQNDGSEDEKRDGVSGAPGRSEPDALPNVSLFSDDVGDGDDVVGISGVFQAEQEAESEDSEYAGVDVHMSSAKRSVIKYESQVSTDWAGQQELESWLKERWHARRDSNPRPSGSKPDALSPELRAHVDSRICKLGWGGRRELNPRSSGPQPDVLTATLRPPRGCIREVCIGLILN